MSRPFAGVECGTRVAATMTDDEGLPAVVNVRRANLPDLAERLRITE